MALFLDIHEHIPGLTRDAVIGAHKKDLELQKKYNVEYKKYWYDDTGKVFCLVEAPDKESAIAVHREGHGLIADKIFEVHEGE